jgi:hypothetical protein
VGHFFLFEWQLKGSGALEGGLMQIATILLLFPFSPSGGLAAKPPHPSRFTPFGGKNRSFFVLMILMLFMG